MDNYYETSLGSELEYKLRYGVSNFIPGFIWPHCGIMFQSLVELIMFDSFELSSEVWTDHHHQIT